MLIIEGVLEDLNFGGNMYQTNRSIRLLRKQVYQGWKIDRGAVFSAKQITTHSNKLEKTQSVTLSTSRPFP
jgi:hypothetical protein